MDDQWHLNEEDLWEEEPPVTSAVGGPPSAEDLLRGEDPEQVVMVYVTNTGEIQSVKLAADWKSRTDARRLSAHVVSAANVATMAAASAQAEMVQDGSAGKRNGAEANETSLDDTPITAAEAMQLIDSVSAELEVFQRQILAAVESQVTAESGGRHVQGAARQGQVVEISVDLGWCSSARNAEIEGEIADVLANLRRKSAPEELVNGPQSPAISKLQALASDPQKLLRRLGLNA